MENEILGKYKLVLGLEIHIQPTTKTKMFCKCDANVFGAEPNTHTCPTCLGLPGALPVPNFEAVRKTHLLGVAFNSILALESRFDRKHYFYPDLPKGYQISQYKYPLCYQGQALLADGFKVELERIHLEEDTAKSMHNNKLTLIDFNTSSLPLIEIVTKPIFRTIESASAFAKMVQATMKDLELGEANMEKGQMRLEPNISLRTQDMEDKGELPKYKVEIKNINSFKFMEKAIQAEILRQKEVLDAGQLPVQENRGYDETSKTTHAQRSKEEAHDYRYFPEPDIPPMKFDMDYFSQLAKEYKQLLANSPSVQKIAKLTPLKLNTTLVQRLVETLDNTQVDNLLNIVAGGVGAETAANAFLNNKGVRELEVSAAAEWFKAKEDKIEDIGELGSVVAKVLAENSDAVANYKNGKESALQFLIGKVMRETKGKADSLVVSELLKREIK